MSVSKRYKDCTVDLQRLQTTLTQRQPHMLRHIDEFTLVHKKQINLVNSNFFTSRYMAEFILKSVFCCHFFAKAPQSCLPPPILHSRSPIPTNPLLTRYMPPQFVIHLFFSLLTSPFLAHFMSTFHASTFTLCVTLLLF